MEKLLITGGAGFAGHHLVDYFLRNTDYELVILDKLSYATDGLARLRSTGVLENSRVSLFTANLEQPLSHGLNRELGDVTYILHLAAESHVDRSIADPGLFIRSNVMGTHHILEYARSLKNLKGFLYFSTDEVFGPAPSDREFKEWDRYNSTNPYSATKAAAEEICLAYANTYKPPLLVIHTMNLFGERQYPEKYIPLVIKSLLDQNEVTIHADSDLETPGSRYYTHCTNLADATLFLLQNQDWNRDKINIVGEREVNNLELAQKISEIVGQPLKYKLVDFHSSRPGHDLRYSLDGTKIKEKGWNHPYSLDEALEKTVRWYLENPDWLYLRD